jgi:hypothetical protein
LLIACGSDGGGSSGAVATVTGSPTELLPTPTSPFAAERLTLSGSLTVDGEPLDAEFLGVNVIHDGGLINACQTSIPAVRNGGYEIGVKAAAETMGCGAPGAQVVLWTSIGNGLIYSTESLPWPGAGKATFDTTFSTSDAPGARPSATEFFGHISDSSGQPLAENTVVEAYIGETLCGLGTVYDYAGELGFVLAVAGPERPGCDRDGTITFRAEGRQAVESATNSLTAGEAQRDLRLTLSS